MPEINLTNEEITELKDALWMKSDSIYWKSHTPSAKERASKFAKEIEALCNKLNGK